MADGHFDCWSNTTSEGQDIDGYSTQRLGWQLASHSPNEPPCRSLGTKPLQNQAIYPAVRQCRSLEDGQLKHSFRRRLSDATFLKDVQSDNPRQSLGLSMLGQPTFPYMYKWYKYTCRPHGVETSNLNNKNEIWKKFQKSSYIKVCLKLK